MNLLLRMLVPLVCATLLLAGCDWNNQTDSGTTKGFARCLEKSEQQVKLLVISSSVARDVCTRLNERPSTDIKVDGTARFFEDSGDVTFIGNLINRSKNTVLTSFTVVVKIEGRKDPITKSFNVWKEPGEIANFKIESKEIDPKPTEEDRKKEHFEWGTRDEKGVTIEF